MARTITEIKKIMTDAFMADETIRAAYGLGESATFSESFSSLSIESILFYIVAACHYTLEVIFDAFKSDVDDRVESSAHRPKWYRDKALSFMVDIPLVDETDTYDTSGMSDEEISEAQVVKYAAATESNDSTILTIKVAGGSTGNLSPLSSAVATQLAAYFAEIKDAGVRIAIVNQNGDSYSCNMDVYYNPLMTSDDVKSAVEDAIKSYISGLPFNGVYSDMACCNAVQAVDGVEIVKMNSSSVKASGDTVTTTINAKYRPVAGYMIADTLDINMIAYDEQI